MNFHLCFRKIQGNGDKCRYFTSLNLFSKLVTNTMINFHKHMKTKFISIFKFSLLYAKLAHYKLLMVLHNLINFCFDGIKKQYIRVSRLGVHW